MNTNYNELSDSELLRLAQAKMQQSSTIYSHELLVAIQTLAAQRSARHALIAYLMTGAVKR